MEITDKALDEFITLWEATYGTSISRKDAHEYARQLLQLTKVVYGIKERYPLAPANTDSILPT